MSLHRTRPVAAVAAIVVSSQVLAQQFVNETSTRFPDLITDEYTNQITIGDVDGDDDLDIIFANGGNFSSPGSPQRQRLYLNDGNGFFTDSGAIPFVGLCRGAEFGDIDNDGDLDLVLAQDFDRLPQLFVNDGSGEYTSVTATQLPKITLSSSRAQFGDIDNDGDLDLYITSGTTSRFSCGQYRVYVNDGNGFFTDETASRHPIRNVCNNMDAIFGDIDNDFDIDIRTASTGTNNSRLYRNDGTGVFSQVGGVPSDSTCYSYDFGDMDGDGDLDLLGANGGPGSTEILLANDGTGAYTNVSVQISPNLSQDDNDTKFFDYDDDGDLDLLIARLGSGGEKIFNNDGSGNFTQVSGLITVVSDSSLDIMVADLDNDGRLDIVTAQGESGSFENKIYMNVSGPVDTHAPRIIDTEQVADIESAGAPHVVRALILDDMTSDRNFFDKGIFLNYSVNGGKTVQVSMRHSGGQVYRGEIPAQGNGSNVEYFVSAIDWNDNEGIGETLSFSVGGIPGDFNGDGSVTTEDLLTLLGAWGRCDEPCPPSCAEDLDGDCNVATADLLTLLGNWG